MTTLYPEIKTKNWQISTAGCGVVAEGLADIRQCLDVILRTVKGSDPLRPQFGSDIYRWADKPMNVAIPNVVRAIIEAAEIWEKRVEIKSISYEIQKDSKQIGDVKFFITYGLVDDELVDVLAYFLNGGFVNNVPTDIGSLTLYALFPPNPNGKRYQISFVADDNIVLPLPPSFGFTTLNDLYNWVVANWGNYGRWQMGNDRITLSTFANIMATGSLTMSLVGAARFATPVPNLLIAQNYQLVFVPDGVTLTPPDFSNIGSMLSWVNTNWNSYGTWQIEGNGGVEGDFETSEFDEMDFDTGTDASYILALYSETVQSASLQVNAI